jgi:hypothetical protein
MALDSVGAWLWDKFGKDITDKALDKAKERWQEFKWTDAAQKYRERMKELYSTTRMLGKPDPISLEGIFTDVYLLDRPTASLRFNIEELRQRQQENESAKYEVKRVSALRLASAHNRLFILGKPGAGKTTFLKYLTLQATEGKLNRVPIFVSLNIWANSGLELMPFIVRQFEICAFPDAQAFIEHLLQSGQAMVCFDGLDEVNEAEHLRSKITRAITDFTNQYAQNKQLITCRIAATDYTFGKFTYVEMADFTLKQVQSFVGKWFGSESDRAERFLKGLQKKSITVCLNCHKHHSC